MELSCEEYGAVTVISTPGPRLDSSVAAEFRDAARELMHGDQPIWLMDLSNVTFVDSSGVGALVGLLKFIGRERRLELCGLSPTVSKVFKLTRLDSVFTIYPDLDAGLNAHGAHRTRAAG